MENDLKGLHEFLEVAESTHKSDVANSKAGIKLVTAREAGIFFGPDTKPSIMNKKIYRLPSVSEWEAMAIEHANNLQSVSADIPPQSTKPQTFNPSIKIERT